MCWSIIINCKDNDLKKILRVKKKLNVCKKEIKNTVARFIPFYKHEYVIMYIHTHTRIHKMSYFKFILIKYAYKNNKIKFSL